MKIRNLLVLTVVLVMSFAFLGCPPEEDDPAALNGAAEKILKDNGYNPSDFIIPTSGKFGISKAIKTKDESLNGVIFTWTETDSATATSYLSAWKSKEVTTSIRAGDDEEEPAKTTPTGNSFKVPGFFSLRVEFAGDTATSYGGAYKYDNEIDDTISIANNTLIFVAYFPSAE